jgi:hypothetical protein
MPLFLHCIFVQYALKREVQLHSCIGKGGRGMKKNYGTGVVKEGGVTMQNLRNIVIVFLFAMEQKGK